MLQEDIKTAQKILGLSYSNYKRSVHHNTSAIYKQSNERMRDYLKYFKNKQDMLTVIASSDQIINAILEGAKNIDAFDISSFPQYFMFLKFAALKSLTREEYIDFFLSEITTDEKYDDIYFDLIRKNLPKESKEFWDSLFHFYDWCDIYESALFSSDPISNSYTIKENKYLEKDEYNKLKELIDKINIKTHQCNFLELPEKLNKKYDLVYLSNIIYYVNILEYKKTLEKIDLKDNGEILTYFYKKENHVLNYFKEKNYRFDQFKETSSGILVYKKLK